MNGGNNKNIVANIVKPYIKVKKLYKLALIILHLDIKIFLAIYALFLYNNLYNIPNQRLYTHIFNNKKLISKGSML